MIVFNLICLKCEYPFEGWFDDTNAFNSQKKRKLINCPNCESSHVSKTLVAPNVSKKSNSKPAKNKKTLASNIKKIRKIVEKFIISDKEKSPIYRFLEAVKLEGHMPARPFLFLYYIFTFIAQDEEKESITSYRQYLIDVMSSYKTLSWHNNPVFTNKIKDEISARFELDVSEDECKTLVQNAEITLEKLEEKMPASMIKYHRNIKLKSLFPDKF